MAVKSHRRIFNETVNISEENKKKQFTDYEAGESLFTLTGVSIATRDYEKAYKSGYKA